MALIAWIADRRLPPAVHLRMQWGQIGWSAPRRFARASLPVFFGAVLLTFTTLGAHWPPLGGIFIASQLFHIWMVHRHLTR